MEDLDIGEEIALPIANDINSSKIEQSFEDKYSFLIKHFVADIDDFHTNGNSNNSNVTGSTPGQVCFQDF